MAADALVPLLPGHQQQCCSQNKISMTSPSMSKKYQLPLPFNLLTTWRWCYEVKLVIFKPYFEQFLWNCLQVNATRHLWWLVNIGSGKWFRQNIITWANVGPDLGHHWASISHNVITLCIMVFCMQMTWQLKASARIILAWCILHYISGIDHIFLYRWWMIRSKLHGSRSLLLWRTEIISSMSRPLWARRSGLGRWAPTPFWRLGNEIGQHSDDTWVSSYLNA